MPSSARMAATSGLPRGLGELLPRRVEDGPGRAPGARAEVGREHVGHAQHLGHLADAAGATGVAAAVAVFMVLQRGLQPVGVVDPGRLQLVMDLGVGADLVALGVVEPAHGGDAALHLDDAQVHRRGRLHQGAHPLVGPAGAAGGQLAHRGAAQRMAQAARAGPVRVLPRRVVDADVAVAVDQRHQLGGEGAATDPEAVARQAGQQQVEPGGGVLPQVEQRHAARLAAGAGGLFGCGGGVGCVVVGLQPA